ncbi:hypothetical protein [Mycobacteroides chelonae]|uniref:hypothetical protein n=1 Tax=Mycobacteroides chelonae TaxID=1774 RepID=UPI000993B4AC|nr:hypothetical protein [Mycobacteroides chelonae]
MVALHVDKLSTGQTRVIVHHNWGRGTWTETIPGPLREGKEYARFDVQPDIQVRIRYVDAELIAEVHSAGKVHILKDIDHETRT